MTRYFDGKFDNKNLLLCPICNIAMFAYSGVNDDTGYLDKWRCDCGCVVEENFENGKSTFFRITS